MNLFYVISTLILYFVTLFIKKSQKKYNFIITSIFTILIFYFFNILLISFLSFLKVPTSLFLLCIINVLLIVLILIFNYKKGHGKFQLQKYEYNRKQIIFSILIFIICFGIGLVRFDKFSSISYETTDPAVHYKVALNFRDNLSLLNKTNSVDEVYGNFNHSMPGFSLNCGVLMKIFSFVSSYKIYMIYDTFILFLLACSFYITCLKIKRVHNKELDIFILTCLYLSGYALNNLVFGFGYLGVGVITTNLIIFTWLLIENNENKKNNFYLYILLFLFNFSLFFSYYLFMPVVYLAQGLYLIFKWIKKEYLFKDIVIIGLIILIVPFIIGFVYFMLPNYLSSSDGISATSAIALEGYIYRDLWSNFILICPLIIFSIVKSFKDRRITFLSFIFIIELIYILITFILGLKGHISSYYYFKSYFVLWLLCFLCMVRLVNYNNKDCNIIFKIGVYYMLLIVIICLSNIESNIQNKNVLFNNTIVSPSYVNIYYFNASKIMDKNKILNNDELEILSNAISHKEECVNNKEIPVVGNYLQKLWFYSISNIVPVYNHVSNNLGGFYEEKFDYEKWINDNNSKCLVIFNSFNSEDSDNYINIHFKDFNILYQNESGYLIKK